MVGGKYAIEGGGGVEVAHSTIGDGVFRSSHYVESGEYEELKRCSCHAPSPTQQRIAILASRVRVQQQQSLPAPVARIDRCVVTLAAQGQRKLTSELNTWLQ